MPLLYNEKQLSELMEDFYILTGMRLALFDENLNQIIKYRSEVENFCDCMRKSKEFDEKCKNSDKCCFEICKKTKALYISKCHAGLCEATAPLMENGRIIGYMMFGQVADSKEKSDVSQNLKSIAQSYGTLTDRHLEHIEKIKSKSTRQFKAAANILDACTKYVLAKELVRPSGEVLIKQIEKYVDDNLGESLDVSTLCRHFSISRTALYSAMNFYHEQGIAEFIKHRRLEKARQFVKSSNLTVKEIAHSVGFDDYNYFLKVFKKHFGTSPKKMLRQERECITVQVPRK